MDRSLSDLSRGHGKTPWKGVFSASQAPQGGGVPRFLAPLGAQDRQVRQAPKAAGLFLFTGFLGSGKTTVLNGLLASLGGRRVGVIVNEWGKVGVDGSLLADPSGLGVVELAGGQIFCSCVSGSFISAAVKLASLGLDYLLVETSGLAKPALLSDLVDAVERRGGGTLEYRGMICVVDASRFSKLRSAAMVVEEQVAYSDVFLVTKTDLPGAATLEELRGELGEVLGPEKAGRVLVAECLQGRLEAGVVEGLLRLPGRGAIPGPDPRFQGWGPGGRPGTSTIRPLAPSATEAVLSFLDEVGAEAYRAKGFLRFGDRPGLSYLDWSGAGAVIGPPPEGVPADQAEALVIVWRGAAPPVSELSARWERTVRCPLQVW